MSDDLTTAYLLGVEDMRSKLHKQADEIERLRAENEKFFKQAEMNARLLTENASLRGEVEMLKSNLPARAATRGLAEQHNEITRLSSENEKLRLELDMQQATILVPSQKDDQRRIERLDAALKEALDEAAALRAQIESAEEAYVRLDASINKLKAAFRVNMLRHVPNITHEEIDAVIAAAAIRESGDDHRLD